MSDVRFEMAVTLPADARFAETLTALAAHAAQFAGCDEAAAAEFGASAGDAHKACVADLEAPAKESVGAVIRCQGSELEVALTCVPSTRVARTVRIDV